MKKKIFIILVIFFVLYLILLTYTSNYHQDNGIPIIDIRLNNNITIDEINSNSKDIKYKNNKMTVDNVKYNNVTIKGRGNSTWDLLKKPYQIAFDDKTSILGFEPSKKYTLLANYSDPTLLRNDFTYSVANRMNLGYSTTGKFVDLYIDKKYMGNYYLIPQVKINKSYVNLKDNNAILMELDNHYYAEETYFKTKYYGDYITIKDQKNEDSDEAFKAFQKKYNSMEKNISKKNYKWLKENIDIESFIKYYIVVEFAMNNDSYQSSFYMYMDGLDDKIHAGPIWDFDLGYDAAPSSLPFVQKRSTILFKELLEIKEFKNGVSTYWRTNACKAYKEEIDNLDKKIDYLNKSGEINTEYWYIHHYNKYTDTFKKWVTKRYNEYNKLYGCDES